MEGSSTLKRRRTRFRQPVREFRIRLHNQTQNLRPSKLRARTRKRPLLIGQGFFEPRVLIRLNLRPQNLSRRHRMLTICVRHGPECFPIFRKCRFASRPHRSRENLSILRSSLRGTGRFQLQRNFAVSAKRLATGFCLDCFSRPWRSACFSL